ncbi:hypothetical protein FDECE_5516 [Fusarium decemcellulare]|nr:hypothetical protein FDECE_5516 [Fusarium decemcellulare]
MIIWHSPKAYWAFQNSVQNDQLLNNLKRSQDTEPATQIINFRGQMVWRHMKGPRNDVRIAHFPDPISKETKQDISSVKGLRMAGNWGIIGNQNDLCLSAYRGPATLGWIEGSQTRNGQGTVACVWVHHWKSQEHEERFKATQRSPTETANTLLTVEDFDQSLTDLGAVGWEEFHVDFKQVWGGVPRRL